jgi:two-component system cell cycle sensor histidine kinase/response regulator CckA
MTAPLRVLYYDERPDRRDSLRRLLEAESGHVVTVAHTADEFQRLASAGRFDLVLGPQSGLASAPSASAPVGGEAAPTAASGGLSDPRATAFAEQEAWLGELIASAMDAIITVDGAYRITLFNAAAERMFGLPAAAALGQSLDALLPTRYRNTHQQHVAHFAEHGTTARRMGSDRELRALRANGEEFAVEASISRVQRGDDVICTVILRDVSARRRLEEQLLTAQKLEAIGRLAGGVAHDFNNLLTIIVGNAEALRAELPAGSGAAADAAEIVHAADRGTVLTRQLLAFAKRQEADPRVIDPCRSVAALDPLLRRLIGADIALALETNPECWPIVIDPGQLEQIFVNLVVNARDAMPNGGRITVALTNERLRRTRTQTIPRLPPGEYVRLRVADTGVGMPPAVRERIFEPFFTTKGQGKGTGLGLATVYGIMSQSRGSIEVWSEPGQGTRLDLWFPRGDGVPEEPETGLLDELPISNARRTGTVLVVEDEPAVLRLVAETLRSAGFVVHTASGPEEALQLAGQAGLRLDLVLSDVVIPRRSGLEIMDEVRQWHPGVRALFMSGYADAALEGRGVDPASITLLHKPFTPAALLQAVRRVLEGTPFRRDDDPR